MSSPDNADALRSFLSNHGQELGFRAVIAKVATLKPFSESPEIRVLSVLPVDQPAGPMGMADAESQRIPTAHKTVGI